MFPLKDWTLLVFFRDGMIRKCEMAEYFGKRQPFSVLLKRPDYFARVRIQTGGYGVCWDENLSVSDSELSRMGKRIPLTMDDFRAFVSERMINAAEAAELLNCSRQYINALVKTDKLHPIKASEKNTLFLKRDVLKWSWK